jgi:hypothetical protein
MHDLKTALLQLQGIDREIAQAEIRLAEFEPQLKEAEGPVASLEGEITTARARLEELRGGVRRLETAGEQKRQRLKVYEDRLSRIRNLREESAARAEMDLIRRAADADDTEALELMDQATRTDLKLDEMMKQLERVRADTSPRREELMRGRAETEAEIDVLRDRRQNHAIRLDPQVLRLYDRVRKGRANTALAPLTGEGACGHCFNILPLQEQTEVRSGNTLHRCEACGVILYIE